MAPQARSSGLLINDPACSAKTRAAYEQTFLNVRFAFLGTTGNTLLISAVDESASAAPLAANLALLAAEQGEKVLLVDADAYNQPLNDLFTLGQSPGFTNLIRLNGAEVQHALQTTPTPNLRVVAAGAGGGVPGGLGRAPGLAEVMLRLKNSADRLIIVGTPILTHVDSMDLCSLVDGALLCMMPGKTHREDAARARQVLDRVQAPLLGVVLIQ